MGDYPLDLMSPVRHVATELDKAAGAALSLSDMAASYQHPNTGDLARVRSLERATSNDEAHLWLIERAIAELGKQIRRDDDGYRLTRDASKLRYPGNRKLHLDIDSHAQLHAPFDPMTGKFSDNLRINTGKHGLDDELRESMREFGWLPELPAIKDERGVVLVGHRRLTIAKELRIEPEIRTVKLGDGDAGDAKRFALAIASNLGAKPFTPGERQQIAEYLYGDREWTMQRIADALKVSKGQISKDLADRNVSRGNNSGPGRPKGSKGSTKPRTVHKATPELDAEVRQLYEAGESVNRGALSEKYGVGQKTIQLAHHRAIGAVEEAQRMAQQADLAPEPESLVEPIEQPAADSRHACPTCGYVHGG